MEIPATGAIPLFFHWLGIHELFPCLFVLTSFNVGGLTPQMLDDVPQLNVFHERNWHELEPTSVLTS